MKPWMTTPLRILVASLLMSIWRVLWFIDERHPTGVKAYWSAWAKGIELEQRWDSKILFTLKLYTFRMVRRLWPERYSEW